MEIKFTRPLLDNLWKLLERELIKAQEDYKKKKEIKGEKIDLFKMNKAINQRKKLKILGRICLAGTFQLGNILQHKTIDEETKRLLLEAKQLNEIGTPIAQGR